MEKRASRQKYVVWKHSSFILALFISTYPKSLLTHHQYTHTYTHTHTHTHTHALTCTRVCTFAHWILLLGSLVIHYHFIKIIVFVWKMHNKVRSIWKGGRNRVLNILWGRIQTVPAKYERSQFLIWLPE